MKPTLEELAAAVATMRHHQKEYFRTRSTTALQYAKASERVVDEMLKLLSERSLFDA